MVIKVYISGISGNKEVKKRQQRVLMILDSKNVQYEVVDIAEPGNEEAKEFMQNNAKSLGATIGDANPKHALPPQVFNDEEYCGDYDMFDLANEMDEIEKFLKLTSNDVVTSNAEIKLENGDVSSSDIKENHEQVNGETEANQVKEETNQVKEETNQEKEEINPATEEANQVKEETNQAKEEANQPKEEAEQAKEEANQAKEEVNQPEEEVNQAKEEISDSKNESVENTEINEKKDEKQEEEQKTEEQNKEKEKSVEREETQKPNVENENVIENGSVETEKA